jgi:hypothetical protein
MLSIRLAIACGAAWALLLPVAATPAGAQLLITEAEAKLPPPSLFSTSVRGVTRGPKVLILSPAPGAPPGKAPLKLKLKFESYGGSKIDVDSIKVVYVKEPTVDLTKRVKPYIDEEGTQLDMAAARVPPGEHMIRVDVQDNEGRTGSANFVLKVVK